MVFWDRFKGEVKRQNTTQEWVARNARVSFRTLQGWIAKGRLPDAQEAVAIARALGVTVEYLVTGTDSTDPWLREHRQLLDDLKALPADKLADQEEAVHAVAEKVRRELGKNSASG